jgi:putative ABC transport system permease protein
MAVPFPRSVRSGWRLAARSPGIHVAIVGMLSIGVAFSGLGFTVLSAVLGPFGVDPGRVARLGPSLTRADGGTGVGGMRLPLLREVRREASSFSAVVGVNGRRLPSEGVGLEDELWVAEVSEGFFDLVGVHPSIGRSLVSSDERPGAPRVCVLGHGVWQRTFGGDVDALGATVLLGDVPHAIIGVMPRGFTFPHAEVWTPLPDPAPNTPVAVLVRLAKNASWEGARAETATIGSRLAREYPDDFAESVLSVRTLEEESRERLGVGILGLMGPPFVLLVVAILNVAILLLAQAIRREREVGIRMALGAGKPALLRQFLAEGLLLALPAGLLGVVLIWAGLAVLRATAPHSMGVLLAGVNIRFETASFVGLLTLLLPVLCGLAPLLHSLRLDPVGALHAGSRRRSGVFRHYGFPDLAVVLQVAGALALVAWFANVERLFGVLSAPRWGFDVSGVGVTRVAPGEPGAARDALSDRQLVDTVRSVPGVASATLVDRLPSPFAGGQRVFAVGTSSAGMPADLVSAADGLFETLGVGLLEGRPITEDDVGHTADVAVVSESLARALWPDRTALGQVVRLGSGSGERELTVIVVAPTLASLSSLPRPPHRLYVPLSDGGPRSGGGLLILRSSFEDPTLARRLQKALAARSDGWAIGELTPIGEFVQRQQRDLRAGLFLVRLVGVIGLVTLALAAIGLFAVTHQAVHAGTRELGIRAALGATPGQLLRLVHCRSLVQTALGAGVGLGATLWGLSVGFQDALHVGVRDPRVWIGVLVALAAPALGGHLPALRAARIDPARVMREE